MTFRDIAGSEVKEGDRVFVPVSLGTAVVGTVSKLHVGIELSDVPSQPWAVIDVSFTIPASPNHALGVMRMPMPNP